MDNRGTTDNPRDDGPEPGERVSLTRSEREDLPREAREEGAE